MRGAIRRLFMTFIMVQALGCAFSAQTVKLDPTPRVQPGNIGNGRSVFINTVDERPSDVLGHRAAGSVGSEITAGENVVTVVSDSLTTGLRQLGFQPVTQAGPGIPELRVEIRSLTYLVSQGFWSGGLDVDASLKAICIIGGARPYEHLYRGHHEENVQVVQTAAQNDEYINSALTRVLEETLGDTRLMTCLAGDSTGTAPAAS